jgi:Golgi transport complex subunit 5
MAEEEPSYIDYEAFLDPDFSATDFANTLVLTTNNPSDTPLDLSTPLSRVLFDVQEVDTHIDSLTTKSALPLLAYTRNHAESSGRILQEVDSHVASLTEEYRILEKEVVERYEAAEQVRLVAERLVETVRLGREVGRALMLGRQLEVQVNEFQGVGPGKKGDHRAMVRCANTLVMLRQLLGASKAGEEGYGLDRVNVVQTLKTALVKPAERSLLQKAQQIVREFSMSSLLTSATSSQSTSTFAQTEDTKSRAASALLTLYLLSPASPSTTASNFVPTLLLSALQEYLQTALKSSLASLTRSLATLPTLDRTLVEISARCQNIVALEALLHSTKPPQHPLFSETSTEISSSTAHNLLQTLLLSLDTSSLPSYFWRSLASALSPRVQDIMNRGGVSARTLRSNKDRVRDLLRQCVDRGSQLGPTAFGRGKPVIVGNWEREAAVMVGAVVGVIGR